MSPEDEIRVRAIVAEVLAERDARPVEAQREPLVLESAYEISA